MKLRPPGVPAYRALKLRPLVLAYRTLAYITGCLIIVLCAVGIPLQVAGHPQVQQYVGEVHGFLYILYVVVAFTLSATLKLRPSRTVLVMLAGTIPVLTFIVERWMTRTYIRPALALEAAAKAPEAGAGGAQPRTPARS